MVTAAPDWKVIIAEICVGTSTEKLSPWRGPDPTLRLGYDAFAAPETLATGPSMLTRQVR